MANEVPWILAASTVSGPATESDSGSVDKGVEVVKHASISGIYHANGVTISPPGSIST